MALFKWYARVDAARSKDSARPNAPLEPFDYDALRPKGYFARIVAKLALFAFRKIMPPALRLIQEIWPVIHLRFLNLALVTRHEYVSGVLADDVSFEVPYGREMNMLANGTTFALGLDGDEHARLRQIMMDVTRPDDDLKLIVDLTRHFSEALFENGNGRLDVISDLITRVATETSARYLGIEVEDPDAFALWSFSVSGLLFGDPTGNPENRKLAVNGGQRLCYAIDKSIRLSRGLRRKRGDSLLDRLVTRSEKVGDIDDKNIRATLLGLATGFIPTNALAAANILTELLRKKERFEKAREYAADGKRDEVRKIIMECARLNSALQPGLWRVAATDAVVALGSRHEKWLPAGTVVLAATMPALRDRRKFPAPNRFRPDRAVQGDMMFGEGVHVCMGKYLAIEQITEIFTVMLAQPGIRPIEGKCGKLDSVGAFPVRLDMEYQSDGATQTMFLVVVTVPADFENSKADIDAKLAHLGNPASDRLAQMLDATGVVHFASLSTIESSRGVDIVFELSVDGKPGPALLKIGQHAGFVLRPIYELAGLGSTASLAEFLERHIVRLHSAPWGATGVDYYGTGEFSIPAIARQRDFAALSGKILAEYLGREIGNDQNPMAALNYVRSILRGDPDARAPKTGLAAKLINESLAAGFDAYMLKPMRSKLRLAGHEQSTVLRAAMKFLQSKHGLVVEIPVAVMLFVFGWMMYKYFCPPQWLTIRWPSHWSLSALHELRAHIAWREVPDALWDWFRIIGGALIATLAATAVILGLFVAKLRWHETRDKSDTEPASIDQLKAIAKQEDRTGYVQNHFMAVGQLKAGPFRMLVHAIALWGIKMIIFFFYRPGFVIDMGTIHYARWWRLPGTRTSVFYANYDGSWESYLEDFITRARWGQTAAWSNWRGFPKTKFLVFKGAEDGDRFKRWVRTQQAIVPFWYTRFPDLTSDQIRTNALIHHGIARTRTDDQAREWLRCFGSMPRLENKVEAHEVQSLVFRGMRGMNYSACLAIKLPPQTELKLGKWMGWITGEEMKLPKGSAEHKLAFQGGSKLRDGFDDQSVDNLWRLRQEYCIAFGDRVSSDSPDRKQRAAFLAYSAAGMRQVAKIGSDPLNEMFGGFSPAFQMGMTARDRVLGDLSDAAPENWRWSDGENGAGSAAEAAMLIYAESPEDLQTVVSLHVDLLKCYGGSVVFQRDCEPGELGPDFEHFGFRDGISQPVIRGTARARKEVPARDIVEPGEFVLGYESNQGFLPPSPMVREEADIMDILPSLPTRHLSRYPDFGAGQSVDGMRDFGRNGSYLVIREIRQDVDALNAFALWASQMLAGEHNDPMGEQPQYPELFREAGEFPNQRWIKAKMVGRWPDGRPLVGNPLGDVAGHNPTHPLAMNKLAKSQQPASDEISRVLATRSEEFENDFSYGTDDPQGFACPFGAHIRRTNPRDSKQPGAKDEQTITNRHRLLRRGRSYTDFEQGKMAIEGVDPGIEIAERGLLFVALCADIERQFEFVQQTWINAPGFHGLENEPDPLIAASTTSAFTIPTPAGPVKLTTMDKFTEVKGGGYFFLPSRSALAFLRELAIGNGGG